MLDDNLLRVMSLHSLTYCERLFYLEEVEEIKIADRRVYSGRRLHEEIKKSEEEDGIWNVVEMSSEKLGLVGKVDCLKRRDSSLIPFEYKRGRAKRKNGKAAAWESDLVQVAAYGMLLEEHFQAPVPEGRIRYLKDNVTVRVQLTEEVREKVLRAVERARFLASSDARPPVTKNDRLCIKCSLAPVCLPEEERFISEAGWEPIRLFPPHRDKKIIHVTEPGARIGKSGKSIRIKNRDGDKTDYPITEIDGVVIHGYPQVSTQALHFMARNNVQIQWLTSNFYHITGTISSTGNVQRKIRQYKALTDDKIRLRLCRQLARAKVEAELKYILRATRGADRKKLGIDIEIAKIRNALKGIHRADNPDSIRGLEGTAARSYFSCVPYFLKDGVPDEMRFKKRTRRPPRDPFNSLLSYGYSLLYQTVLTAIISVGLEPALGFFHTPRSSAAPLVLDLMELFRLPVWDIALIGSINRRQWDPDTDFMNVSGRYILTRQGKKKAITLFEKRLEEKWKHPVLNYSLSYHRMIELEVRLLEKEWSGSPGLFAQARLR